MSEVSDALRSLEGLHKQQRIREYQVKARDWIEYAEDEDAVDHGVPRSTEERAFGAAMSLAYSALAQDERVTAPKQTTYGNINVGRN